MVFGKFSQLKCLKQFFFYMIKLTQQKLKINSKENKKAVLREEIEAKEILLQRRDELTNKINVLIEQLNS